MWGKKVGISPIENWDWKLMCKTCGSQDITGCLKGVFSVELISV
jgi:hypothetical protein